MGTSYKVFIYDEFNWQYQNSSKKKIIDQIKINIINAEIIADFDQWIVVDIGKKLPAYVIDKIIYDKIYFQRNGEMLEEFNDNMKIINR